MKEYRIQRRKMLSLAAAAVLLLFTTSIATAKVSATAKDEKKLTAEISMINNDAAMPRGDAVVVDRLSKEFKVTPDRIKALLDQKLSYGDIAAVYAFADKMPGGLTDDNVNTVVSERQANKGWRTIAGGLNVDLGRVAGKVKGVEKDVHKDIKKASTETRGSAGGGRSAPDRSAPLYQ